MEGARALHRLQLRPLGGEAAPASGGAVAIERAIAPRRSALALLAAVALGGCEGGAGSPAVGFTYNWGDERFASFLRAELERDRADGDAVIRLVTVDSGGWPMLGATMLAAEVGRARRLADDTSVVVVIGPGGSREALQVAPIYRDAGLMQLVPTATSRLLEPLRDWTLVLVPNDSVQGEFIGRFALDRLAARRLAIFYVPDEYGIGLAAGTSAALESRGATVILRAPMQLTADCRATVAASTYEALVAQLAGRGVPDAVVVASRQTEAACLTRELRKRWPGVPVLAGDGTLLDPTFFDIAGASAEGVHVVAFWHPDAAGREGREFAARFEAAVDRPLRHADVVYYDAVMLAATAIRDGGASRAAVKRYLRSLGTERPPFQGLTGPIAFTPGAPRTLVMTRVQGRGSVIVSGRW